MNTRVNPFDSLTDLPAFETKPKKGKPPEQSAVIERIAEENNFTSRQAPKIARTPKRKRRVYTTGRNQQFNIKATAATVDRFYRLADENGVSLCKLLEQALDALERGGASH